MKEKIITPIELFSLQQRVLTDVAHDNIFLGDLRHSNFRPDQSPNASFLHGGGRVLFTQNHEELKKATFVRVPLCLLSAGDTKLLREGQIEFGQLRDLTQNLPTAAMLLDSINVTNLPFLKKMVWFSEEALFTATAARNLGITLGENWSGNVLPDFFAKEAHETLMLLQNIVGFDKQIEVQRVPITADQTRLAIKQAMEQAFNQINLKFKSKQRSKISHFIPAQIASTHALFPLIVKILNPNEDSIAAVQGPIHLETHPKHWRTSLEFSSTVEFLNETAKYFNNFHRSWLPCMFSGSPVGEFSAFENRPGESPQLRRDQRWKIELWASNKMPFPLKTNPLFSHAIGLAENSEVEEVIKLMIEAESRNDSETGRTCQIKIAEILDFLLCKIVFWK